MGEGLLLSSRVAKCVAGNVVGSDGCRDPPGTVGTIERDCDVDDGDRRVSLRATAAALGTGYRLFDLKREGIQDQFRRRRRRGSDELAG